MAMHRHMSATLTSLNGPEIESLRVWFGMDDLHQIFPAHILNAAPPPDRCGCAAEYLDYMLDCQPHLLASALPHASHDELAELVLIRRWSRARPEDRQAMYEIARLEGCDFWLAFAMLLRAFPSPSSDEAEHALAAHLATLINSGTLRMQHSDTPVISRRGLDIYEELSRRHEALQIAPAIIRSAHAHAGWLERGRAPGRRYAMFNGNAILAANRPDPD